MAALSSDSKIAGALAALTLEEMVQLLTGRDFWTTWPIEKIGLRRILVRSVQPRPPSPQDIPATARSTVAGEGNTRSVRGE